MMKELDIKYRQQVYQIAESLASKGSIIRAMENCSICQKTKKCSWSKNSTGRTATRSEHKHEEQVQASGPKDRPESPKEFEDRARASLSVHFGNALNPRAIDDVPKVFDFVSSDGQIAGDAKYYSLVKGTGLPPAKFSAIAEHVWLLGHTMAKQKFLVFGNDVRVPKLWLARFGKLVQGVLFFFLNANGDLEQLAP